MGVTISHKDLGSPCEGTVAGTSLDEIVQQMRRHAVDDHGYTKVAASSPDFLEQIRGAVRQSARPASLRASKLAV